MRRIPLIPFIVLLIGPWTDVRAERQAKDTLPSAPEGKTWKLVWHDEFDGTKLDESEVGRPARCPRDATAGGCARRSRLDGKGHLVISTLKDGDKYIDGCVRTQGKFEHAFGYYVARIQLAEAAGPLVGVLDHGQPAWARSATKGGTAPRSTSWRSRGSTTGCNHALHWDGYGKDHKSEGKVVEGARRDGGLPHVRPAGGSPTSTSSTWTARRRGAPRRAASARCRSTSSSATRSATGRGDISKAKLPDQFLVDYVRVYDLVEKKWPGYGSSGKPSSPSNSKKNCRRVSAG